MEREDIHVLVQHVCYPPIHVHVYCYWFACNMPICMLYLPTYMYMYSRRFTLSIDLNDSSDWILIVIMYQKSSSLAIKVKSKL